MSHAATLDEEGYTGPPHVHHMDAPTAYKSAKLGMWLFLATELLLFAVLFVSFFLYRFYYNDEFFDGHKTLNVWLGSLNTLILLFSSATAAIAVTAAQKGNNALVSKLLLITFACGIVFLGVKAYEYTEKASLGKFPGVTECAEGVPEEKCVPWNSPKMTEHYRMYYGLYYSMTGLHALHVVIGMGLLGWVWTKSRKGRFSSQYYTPVEIGALYWHLVDLIWIYLFPLLYLVD